MVRHLYDWDVWLTNKWKLAVVGEDFEVSVEHFRIQACREARSRDLQIETAKINSKELLIRAHPNNKKILRTGREKLVAIATDLRKRKLDESRKPRRQTRSHRSGDKRKPK